MLEVGMGAGVDIGALIEAVYHVGGGDQDWLLAIACLVRAGLDRGRGVVACLFQLVHQRLPAATVVVGVGELGVEPRTVADAYLGILTARAGSARMGALCGTARAPEPASAAGEQANAWRACARSGIRGCAGIIALGGPAAARAGCALLFPLSRCRPLPRAFVALWSRVARHLHAGLQLRRSYCPEDVVWRGLVTGRWDLLDHFDSGGRRFIVARRRPPQAPLLLRLTDRERAACAQAALGRSNKVIAAELGVAVSTAGMLLLRATRKLSCASREDLIHVFRAAEEQWADQPGANGSERATIDPARRAP